MRLLTVGRPKHPAVRDGIEDYGRRIQRWSRWSWEAVADARGDGPEARERETDRLLDRLAARDFVVLLDVRGVEVDSRGLSEQIAAWRDEGRALVFVVGGSGGVGARLEKRADWRWSLSRLTFPHDLAQLLVAEQLYRALSISHGTPYHRE